MNKIMKVFRRMGRSQGMTLIEIMVVVTIIGIVATMGVVAVTSKMKKAQVKIARTQIASLAEGVESYSIDHGSIPSQEEGLQVLLEGEYIKKLPTDPWKKPYRYIVPGSDGSEFEIVSNGPDKQEGTDDDVTTADSDAGN